MIEIRRLEKFYGADKVIDDVSLTIRKGEIFAIVGHSGAGKSTLLRCINGLENYSGGSLTVNKEEVGALRGDDLRSFRKKIGMIFQHFSLMQRKTVFENIALPMRVWNYPDAEIQRKVTELLELVGLTDKRDVYPNQLSGGQKQRVAIARALTLEPEILLSDEATSALDPNTTQSILQLLDTINKQMGITIVLVTHEMDVVKSIAYRAALLEHGKLVGLGTVEELFLHPTPDMRAFLGEEESLPETGVNIRLTFARDNAHDGFVARMARELDADFSIAWGRLEKIRDHVIGHLVLNVPEADRQRIEEYLRVRHVHWEVL